MKSKSKFKLLISEITAVGINVVPLLLWLFEDYSAETIMILYALENVVALLLAVLCVLFLAPTEERKESSKPRVRSKIIIDFLLMGLGLTLGSGIFLSFFIFAILKADVTLSAIGFGLLSIAAFQLFEFFSNLYLLRPLSLAESETLLTRGLGRIAFLFISVFIGIFLAAFADNWFVLPFIILKTIIDIAEPIQFFIGKEQPIPSIYGEKTVKNKSKF